MDTEHAKLVELFEQYVAESSKFDDNNNRAAGTRARKALMEISKLCKSRRAEIQESKNG